MKRSAVAGSVLVLGFLVAASCGDSSEGTGDKGTKPDAGEAGDGGSSTTGGSGQGGTAGSASGGTSGKSGTGGKATGGTSTGGTGEAGGGNAGDSGSGGAGDTGPGGEGGKGTGKGGTAGTGGTGGTMITCPAVADFPEAWAQHICTKNVDCCGSDEATCRTTAEAGILQLYPALEASVANNTAELNCDDFIACMTAINAASCANWPKELQTDFGIPVDEPKCRSIIRGRITSGNGTNGPACTQNYQCIGGHCTDPDNTGTQAQQCIAFRGTGAACFNTANAVGEADDLCNPTTHFCNGVDADTAGQCITRFDNGAVCTGAGQCESRQCSATTSMNLCVKPTTCVYIPQPPMTTCAVSNVGERTGTLGWFALSGMALLGAAGMRRRRRR